MPVRLGSRSTAPKPLNPGVISVPIDPYSPCPGGTGKKVKFCCADLVQELDKVQRMLEGEQPLACLDHVRKLDEQYPGRACLQSIRLSLENAVGDHAAAEATLNKFLVAASRQSGGAGRKSAVRGQS